VAAVKRTPLVRKTPMRRTPMRRGRPASQNQRPIHRRKRLDPDEHRHVRERDGMCFGALMALRGEVRPHVCRNQFGAEHLADDIEQLTVDHFHHHVGGTKGKKAEHDRFHLVAMCHWLNTTAPSHTIRQGERRYMKWLIENDRA
jgi:hypothetical protein